MKVVTHYQIYLAIGDSLRTRELMFWCVCMHVHQFMVCSAVDGGGVLQLQQPPRSDRAFGCYSVC